MGEEMANGGRVTTKEFYDKLTEVEQRIIRRLDALDCNIDENRKVLAVMEERTQSHERRLDSQSTKIGTLQESDRKWGAFNAALVALGSFIATVIGIKN